MPDQRWAAQPGWALEYTIGQVVCTPDDAEGDGTEPTGERVVWLGEGHQVGYLASPPTPSDGLHDLTRQPSKAFAR